MENAPSQQHQSKSGLKIENTPTRGLGFTDTLGTKYGLAYITTTITNDSTIPIHLQIAFSKEYDYPIAYGDEQFKVIPLPKEWALNGVEITDSIINELPKYIDKPFLNRTLEPRERCVATIGILRPIRTNLCSATPYAILEYSDRGIFPSCEWLMSEGRASNPELAIGFKVGFCTIGEVYESCMIIHCGQISYTED